MYFLNIPGLIGIVLVVVLGHWLYAVLPVRTPGLDEIVINAGALFLGVYALTVDRCEVPGLLRSYRANLQNFFAAMAEGGMGTYDKPVVAGRRLSFFFLPLVVAPWITLLFGLGTVAYDLGTAGRVSRLDRFRNLELPLAVTAIWTCYALATRSLRLRVGSSTRESVY